MFKEHSGSSDPHMPVKPTVIWKVNALFNPKVKILHLKSFSLNLQTSNSTEYLTIMFSDLLLK